MVLRQERSPLLRGLLTPWAGPWQRIIKAPQSNLLLTVLPREDPTRLTLDKMVIDSLLMLITLYLDPGRLRALCALEDSHANHIAADWARSQGQ